MRFETKPIVRLALIGVAAAALTACASHEKPGPGAPEPLPPPPPPPMAHGGPPSNRIVPGSIQDFVINVGDRVYFDFNDYGIRADAQPVLAAQASWLNRYGAVQVRIEGNCDERGTREYNLALGERRATSVRNALVALGIPTARIKTISYGKERPAVLGSNEAAWAQNRRGVTVIN